MIPRVKVNYGWRELWRALWRREQAGPDHRARLTARLQDYLGQPYLLLTPSGRGALYLLLKTLPHPRVVIPAYTCKAVVEAARLAGKAVVYHEVQPEGFNSGADEALTGLLDADSVYVATHQFGFPCAIEEIARLCRERGALLLEDVAGALGTRLGGRLAGSFGNAAFYSFDSTKLVNVPLKAGCLTVRDPAWFTRVKSLCSQELTPMPPRHKARLLLLAAVLRLLEAPGLYACYHALAFRLRGRYTADSPATAARPTEFYRFEVAQWQAEIAEAQVARLDELIARRRELYADYRRALDGCGRITLPPADDHGEWAPIRFPILVRGGDKLAYYRQANARGVDFAFSFSFLASPPACQHAHALAAAVLDLPFYTKLTTGEQTHVIRTLRALE